MSTMTLTMIGLENWMKTNDDSLFAEMILPDSELIDRDILINHMLMKCGEFEVLYANPMFLKSAIGNWSKVYQRTFEKWVEGLDVEYNPIENYDRIEEWSDIGSNTGNSTQSSSNTDGGTQTTNDTVSAYDSDTMRPKTTSSTHTDNTSTVNSTVDSTDSSNYKHIGRVHGNIGVTTSAQMQAEFLNQARWSVYDHIAILFQQEFTIPIY